MGKSVDEFFEKYQATRLLVENLQNNMEVMAGGLDEEEQEGLMRVNLIMIRQCLEDFGVE